MRGFGVWIEEALPSMKRKKTKTKLAADEHK
jgi:hypothetical protein